MNYSELPYSPTLHRLIEETAAYASSTKALAQTTAHLCITMCTTPECEAYQILKRLGKDPSDIELRIRTIQTSNKHKGTRQAPQQSKPFVRILGVARLTAKEENASEIHTGHLLYALVKNNSCIASQTLKDFEVFESEVHRLLSAFQPAATA